LAKVLLQFLADIQLTSSIDTADGVLTSDPAPVGHHVTCYRWALAPATASNVDDVIVPQNFTSQPTVGTYNTAASARRLNAQAQHFRHHRQRRI